MQALGRGLEPKCKHLLLGGLVFLLAGLVVFIGFTARTASDDPYHGRAQPTPWNNDPKVKVFDGTAGQGARMLHERRRLDADFSAEQSRVLTRMMAARHSALILCKIETVSHHSPRGGMDHVDVTCLEDNAHMGVAMGQCIRVMSNKDAMLAEFGPDAALGELTAGETRMLLVGGMGIGRGFWSLWKYYLMLAGRPRT